MSALPSPPRQLPKTEAWALRLGSLWLLFGMLLWTLVSLLGWTLVAAYGVKFQSLRHWLGHKQTVSAVVETSGQDRLWSGEPVHRSTALFKVGSQTFRAVGYGSPVSPLSPGQSVQVQIAEGAPEYAWLSGLDPYPINLRLLLSGLGAALSPARLWIIFGLFRGMRCALLAKEGAAVPGRRGRHYQLPRPVLGVFLSQYRTKDEPHQSFWSLGSDVGETPTLLRLPGKRPAVLEHLLPKLNRDGQSVSGVSLWRRVRAASVALMGVFQLVFALGFLLT